MKVKYKKLSFLSFFFFYVLFCYCPHKLLEKKNGYSAPFFYLCSMMEWYTNFCSFRKRFSKQMIFVRIHFFHNLLCQYEEKYCSVGKYYIAREFEETSIFRNSFRYFLILWINNWKMSIISILIYDWYIYIFNYLNIFNSTTNFNDNFNDNLLVKYLSDLKKNLK